MAKKGMKRPSPKENQKGQTNQRIIRNHPNAVPETKD